MSMVLGGACVVGGLGGRGVLGRDVLKVRLFLLPMHSFHFFVVAPRVFISMKNHFRVGEPLPA